MNSLVQRLDMPQRTFEPVGFAPLDLTVVVPVLNEQDNVPVLIAAVEAALVGLTWEIIFVDDGSANGTPALIEKLAVQRRDIRLIRRHGRRGLASAVVEGFSATLAPVVAVMDGDLQHDEAVLPALYEAVASGKADLAVGTRYTAGGSVQGWDARRALASRWATRLTRYAGRTTLSDPMSGFFCIRRDAALDAVPHLSGIGFKILLDLLLSSPRPLRVAELPYRFRSRIAGRSKLDPGVAFNLALLLLDKRTRGWLPPRLIPFAAVGSFGLLVNLALLRAFLTLGGLAFRDAQLLAVALTIVTNFMLHNVVTYPERRLVGVRFWRGLAGYYGVCGIGGLANVTVATLVDAGGAAWWLAGAAGAALGTLWTYTASSIFTWRRA